MTKEECLSWFICEYKASVLPVCREEQLRAIFSQQMDIAEFVVEANKSIILDNHESLLCIETKNLCRDWLMMMINYFEAIGLQDKMKVYTP